MPIFCTALHLTNYHVIYETQNSLDLTYCVRDSGICGKYIMCYEKSFYKDILKVLCTHGSITLLI